MDKSPYFFHGQFFRPTYIFFLEKSLINDKKISRAGPMEISKIKNLKFRLFKVWRRKKLADTELIIIPKIFLKNSIFR